MKTIIFILLLTGLLTLAVFENTSSNTEPGFLNNGNDVVVQQVALDGNNINSWIINTGIFDHDLRTSNTPGFEWPKWTSQDAFFSAGLNVAGYINNQFRMSTASFLGEYAPGYVIIVSGNPVAQTNSNFHIYKVKRGDNAGNNPDWLNWGQMVPYGAPFIDVNHNGVYDPYVDTPGVKNAEQTIFLCMTDGFPSSHTYSEGFGGGTAPMFNEVHLTAWVYNTGFLQDVQFIRWDIINKNTSAWNKAYISIFTDPDLGCADDDLIGCDTTRSLGFCYNSEDVDCNGPFRYTGIVPATGILWLKCSPAHNSGLTSFDYTCQAGSNPPVCEIDPNTGDTVGDRYAYNFMKGVKRDGTHWVIPPGGQQNVTKFVYSGDPESGAGWNEAYPGNPTGCILNCGGPDIYTGTYNTYNYGGDRRMILSSGSDNLTINPGDTQRVLIAQLIARGTSRLNSVTQLKRLADSVNAFACGGFVIGNKPISEQITAHYVLEQNYPNPFNPTTKIKFSIPFKVKSETSNVKLVIFDILGQEVATLVNDNLSPSSYEVEFDGSNYSSGIYFYKLTAGDFTKTIKMVFIK